MIRNCDQLYAFMYHVLEKCRECGWQDIEVRINDAMHLGSSGLEIIGALKVILLQERARLKTIVSDKEIQQAVRFVEKSYGY